MKKEEKELTEEQAIRAVLKEHEENPKSNICLFDELRDSSDTVYEFLQESDIYTMDYLGEAIDGSLRADGIDSNFTHLIDAYNNCMYDVVRVNAYANDLYDVGEAELLEVANDAIQHLTK